VGLGRVPGWFTPPTEESDDVRGSPECSRRRWREGDVYVLKESYRGGLPGLVCDKEARPGHGKARWREERRGMPFIYTHINPCIIKHLCTTYITERGETHARGAAGLGCRPRRRP